MAVKLIRKKAFLISGYQELLIFLYMYLKFNQIAGVIFPVLSTAFSLLSSCLLFFSSYEEQR